MSMVKKFIIILAYTACLQAPAMKKINQIPVDKDLIALIKTETSSKKIDFTLLSNKRIQGYVEEIKKILNDKNLFESLSQTLKLSADKTKNILISIQQQAEQHLEPVNVQKGPLLQLGAGALSGPKKEEFLSQEKAKNPALLMPTQEERDALISYYSLYSNGTIALPKKNNQESQKNIDTAYYFLTNDNERAQLAQKLKLSDKDTKIFLNAVRSESQKNLTPQSTILKIEPIPTPIIQNTPAEQQAANNSTMQTITIKNPQTTAARASIWEAADAGDLTAVEWHIKNGSNINQKSPGDETAIMLASNKGYQEIVNQLISAGADLNQKNINGHTALAFALFGKKTAIISALIKGGADVNIHDRNGDTPLMIAIRFNNEEAVKELLEAGADTNAQGKFGTPMQLAWNKPAIQKLLSSASNTNYKKPKKAGFITIQGRDFPTLDLWEAAARGDEAIVRWYLERSADPNVPNKEGITPLMLALNNKHIKLFLLMSQSIHEKKVAMQSKELPYLEQRQGKPVNVQSLWDAAARGDSQAAIFFIEKGDDIDAPRKDGKTPLMLAALNNHLEFAQRLIVAGALLNLQDSDGNTALLLAVNERHPTLAELLIESGADVTIQNKDGKSALAQAIARGLEKLAKMLLAKGANAQEKDEEDFNLLMLAAYLDYRSSTIIPALIAAGAAVDARDDDDVTALMVAAARGNVHAFKQLLAAGARTDLVDVTGRSALDYAQQSNNKEISALLKSKKSYDKRIALPKAHEATPLIALAEPEPVKIKQKDEVQNNKILPIQKALEAKPVEKIDKKEAVKPLAKVEPKESGVPVEDAGNTKLIKAVKKRNIEEIKNLLKNKVDINAQNKKGETALHIATRWGYLPETKLLLAAGSNPNIAEEDGKTPLQAAVMSGHQKIAELLLKNGADVNAQDTYRGRTPLNWVVRMTVGSVKKIAAQVPVATSVAILGLLLQYGADPSIPDLKKKTPLAWAKINNMQPLVEVLKNAAKP